MASYGPTMALGIAAGGRRINLRGCCNFRDVGGYRTADGSTTRWRSLFRSDGLHLLTSADRKHLGALGLTSVIDLRTAGEVAVQGPVPAALGASVHELPLEDVLPDHPGLPCEAEPARIAEAYGATLAAGVETVMEILAILTDPSSYPAVICCPTGNDRTGIVMAVVLAVIGVPDYLVISDFAASREATIRRVGRMRFENPAAVQGEVDRFGPGLLGVVPGGDGPLPGPRPRRARVDDRVRGVDRHGGRRPVPARRAPGKRSPERSPGRRATFIPLTATGHLPVAGCPPRVHPGPRDVRQRRACRPGIWPPRSPAPASRSAPSGGPSARSSTPSTAASPRRGCVWRWPRRARHCA